MRVVSCGLAVLAGAAFTSSSAATTDGGTIHTGVGSESEARDVPCAPGDSGPVVCVPDRGGDWTLTSEASGDCSQGVTGWQGDCIFAFDAGDHLRIWGTRGIAPTTFTIQWSAIQEDASLAPPPPAGSDEGAPSDRDAATAGGETAASSRPPVVAPAATVEEPTGGEPPPAARDRAVPANAFWDPPVTDVPGYSELTAAPQPSFPMTPRIVREDAGAPAAAGAIALAAAGWVAWSRRRERSRVTLP
ncbi:MAG: hypothetical protein R3343_07125 [Nitriliruptorales bacterium]|nr:hypothetical protein [Nitriliruptorales bacterium]